MDAYLGATARWYAETLLGCYPMLAAAEARQAVERSLRAVALFRLLDDPDAATLWFACAERDVRLRLGVEVEEARLDPQSHAGRRHVRASRAQ